LYFKTLGLDGEAPGILNASIRITSAYESIIVVEREEFTPNEHLTLKLNIVPKASEVFIHTSPTVVSIKIEYFCINQVLA